MDTLFSHKYMRMIVAALGVMIILAVAANAAQMLNLISYEPSYTTIDVEGFAEVTAVPDIGAFSFTVEAEAPDVAAAQEISGDKINDIMSYLKSEGEVDEKDIKTMGYNAYPRYEYRRVDCERQYCDNERVLTGYVVTQNVQVKVRDTGKAGELIGGVGSRGATNMSGLSFEVDDLDALKEEARLLATTDAKEKAKRLAKELEVKLGDIVNFYDGASGDDYYPSAPYAVRSMMEDSMGGGFEEKNFAPEIAVGEDTITAHVTITYQLK